MTNTYLRTRCRAYPRFLPESFRKRIRTVFPYIMVPDWFFADPNNVWWDAVLEHEEVHLEQQSGKSSWVPVFFRLVWFLGKYAVASNRLAYEVEGIVEEIIHPSVSDYQKQILFDDYVVALANEDYGCAAKSEQESHTALIVELLRVKSDWMPV